MATAKAPAAKTEEMLLFHCPACNAQVFGQITMSFDLQETALPSAPELNGGRAHVQVSVKATGLKVAHDCQGVDTAAAATTDGGE